MRTNHFKDLFQNYTSPPLIKAETDLPEKVRELSTPELVVSNPRLNAKSSGMRFHIFIVEVDGQPLTLLSLEPEIEKVREVQVRKFGAQRVGKIAEQMSNRDK